MLGAAHERGQHPTIGPRILELLEEEADDRSADDVVALLPTPFGIFPNTRKQFRRCGSLAAKLVELKVQLNPELGRTVYFSGCNGRLQLGEQSRRFATPHAHNAAERPA